MQMSVDKFIAASYMYIYIIVNKNNIIITINKIIIIAKLGAL